MGETIINSLRDFVAEMSEIQRIPDGERHACWFRGHARASLKLCPGVLRADFLERVRQVSGESSDGKEFDVAIETVEKSINEQFRREGASLLPGHVSDVEIYFLAAHYGLPTRLLDWTANPLAALFFAASESPDDDGEVIAITPDWRLTFGSRRTGTAKLPQPPLSQRNPLVVKTIKYLFDLGPRPDEALIIPLHPDLRSARMLQQGACFTLHMPGSTAINENGKNCRRLRVPAQNKDVLLDELRAAGVTWSTLFPDLDHLALHIREQWKLPVRF